MEVASIAMFAVVPILFLLVAAIPIALGVYVWRDARSRGLNAPLWTVVVVFAPTFIGLIVYLIVRENYSNLRCPKCAAPVKQDYTVCPQCGAKLRPSCARCGYSVEPDWKVCPHCAAPLEGTAQTYTAPTQPKGSSAWKIVLLMLLVPVLLVMLIVGALTGYSILGRGDPSGVNMTMSAIAQDYYRDTDLPQVREWMDSLTAVPGQAYALQYDIATEDETQSRFLIYVSGVDVSMGVEGEGNLVVELHSGTEDGVFCIATSGKKPATLAVTLDGEKIPCQFTPVDFDPTDLPIE